MVSSNPNAKAKHFNQIKMDLNLSNQENTKLTEQLRLKEKQEEANLKSMTKAFQDLQSLLGKTSKDPFAQNFTSVDFALIKMQELIRQVAQKNVEVLGNNSKLIN